AVNWSTAWSVGEAKSLKDFELDFGGVQAVLLLRTCGWIGLVGRWWKSSLTIFWTWLRETLRSW
ncbi:hypothetical protein Droror1_Dr00024579, partial [Drosera rotundifolia]